MKKMNLNIKKYIYKINIIVFNNSCLLSYALEQREAIIMVTNNLKNIDFLITTVKCDDFQISIQNMPRNALIKKSNSFSLTFKLTPIKIGRRISKIYFYIDFLEKNEIISKVIIYDVEFTTISNLFGLKPIIIRSSRSKLNNSINIFFSNPEEEVIKKNK